MSPAHSHVEQSRNTLSFATRAKEVTNTAHINMVVSDKVLVKQLQKEVARLEAELRVPEGNEACSSDALLHAKDLQIQKVAFLPMLVLFILST
jgi:centromeric protein E